MGLSRRSGRLMVSRWKGWVRAGVSVQIVLPTQELHSRHLGDVNQGSVRAKPERQSVYVLLMRLCNLVTLAFAASHLIVSMPAGRGPLGLLQRCGRRETKGCHGHPRG